jgi:hypothetical protein
MTRVFGNTTQEDDSYIKKMLFDIFSLIWFKFTDLDQIGEFAQSYQIRLQIFGATVMSANE